MHTTRRNLIGSAAALGLLEGPRARGQGVAAGPVKLGVLTDMNSVNAASAGRGSVVAATMAAEDFGPVLGQPATVVSADHQNKPDIGASIARQWFDRDGVDVILDLPTSPVALAVQQVGREKGGIIIFSSGATSALTGEQCSPTGIQWSYDTYSVANVITHQLVARGKKRWLFLGGDYAYGISLENDATAQLTKLGASVVGSIRHPLGTSDFSSYLVQAQASPADVICVTSGGDDFSNLFKQANEFGMMNGSKSFATMFAEPVSIRAVGLAPVQGLLAVTGWYWDMNDATRAFAQRFFARTQAMPSMAQAGVYSASMAYMRAVRDAGSTNSTAVMDRLHAMRIDDMFAHGGVIRLDGRMVHDMYLVRVKSPAESKGDWDVFSIETTVPGNDAFRPLDQGGCPYVKT